MHIAYVCREYLPSQRGGGIASYLKEMAHGMTAIGHQVTVICASDDTRKEYEEDDNGVRVIRLKGGDFVIRSVERSLLFRRFRKLYRYHSYRKRIRQYVQSLKDIDVIEVADFGGEGYYLHDLNIPVILRLHTPSCFDRETLSINKGKGLRRIFRQQIIWENQELHHAQYLSSCSQSLKDWCEKTLRLCGNRIRVIYNPVNLNLQRKESEVGQRNMKTILFAGTVDSQKGCGDLLLAGRLLRQQIYEPFMMELYGKTGIWADWLRKNAINDQWFRVCGKARREELQEKYQMADVVCFPSWWDNMPMVCLEAMLNGAIVIASNSGGMAEIITDGVDGFLLPPHQPQLWADKIKFVFNLSKKERQAISANAQKRIACTFSTEVICKEMESYYLQVIGDFKK